MTLHPQGLHLSNQDRDIHKIPFLLEGNHLTTPPPPTTLIIMNITNITTKGGVITIAHKVSEDWKILWDFAIQTDEVITARRPDLLVLDKEKKCAKLLISPYHKILEYRRDKVSSLKSSKI